jgi:hypothetical protein
MTVFRKKLNEHPAVMTLVQPPVPAFDGWLAE